MKKYSVSMVQERLSQARDEAQQGQPVFIQRRGVTHRLTGEDKARPRARRKPYFEVLDPAIERGE